MTPVRSLRSTEPVNMRAVMVLITCALFMEILDGSIITTALPSMARAFGTSAVDLNIGVSAYLLALGIFIPASGWVADRLGTRRVFGGAIAVFTLSSALCGLCDNVHAFVALRVVQGAAGAMMNPVGRLVVMRFTPKDRLMATLSNLIWPALIAPVLGPPIGGFITAHAGWRWIFFLNVPLGVAAIIAACVLVPDVYGATQRRFDTRGFLLSGVGTFAVLTGMEWLVARPGWASIGLTLAGVALLAATVRHFRRAREPLLELTSYAIPTFRIALRGGSLSRMSIGAAPFLLPLMFQVGFGYDAFHAGLLVLPVFAGNLLMKTMTTPVLRRFGYRPVLVVNGMLCAASLAACALLGPGTPTWSVVSLLFASGLFRSMQFTALGTLAFADIPKTQMSDANGLFMAVSQIGMAAGIAVAALCVRFGHWAGETWHVAVPAIDYRFAFVMIGVMAVLGTLDTARLPRGAADHFTGRRT
jgi:EmrB/QacA subfamily drug resistance transporter